MNANQLQYFPSAFIGLLGLEFYDGVLRAKTGREEMEILH